MVEIKRPTTQTDKMSARSAELKEEVPPCRSGTAKQSYLAQLSGEDVGRRGSSWRLAAFGLGPGRSGARQRRYAQSIVDMTAEEETRQRSGSVGEEHETESRRCREIATCSRGFDGRRLSLRASVAGGCHSVQRLLALLKVVLWRRRSRRRRRRL